MSARKTDYGTVILHGLFAAGLGLAFITGLRIATEAPDRQWLNLLDAVLPSKDVWVPHMQAALALVALATAYAVYLFRSGLTARVRLDQVRLRGLFGKGQVRLRALNAVLTWALFATIAALLASGGLLYFGLFAGHGAAQVHWLATWALPLLVALHVLTHASFGGIAQLLRIVRPSRLAPPPPPLDAAELLTMLAEQSARLQPDVPREEMHAPEARLQPENAAEQQREPELKPELKPSWPEHPLRHGLILLVFAAVAFWIALALTRKRFRN